MEKQQGKEQRGSSYLLVFVPSPLQGHITPMLQLASILQSKGFSIIIAHTEFNFPNTSNHPNFNFLPISDGLSNYFISSMNFVEFASILNANCISPLKELLVHLMVNEKEKIFCIIYDGYMYFTDAVAEELKLPSIAMRTTNATTLLTYHAFPRLQMDGYLPLQDDRSLELVPELHPLRFKDLPIFNLQNSDFMVKQIAKTVGVKSSVGVIYNTVLDCLERSSLAQLHQLYKVPIFSIGPLHKIAHQLESYNSTSSSTSILEEDHSCLEWLKNHMFESVIYVSLGSIACWDEKELTEMAWGLANSGQPFLWVIRPSGTVNFSDWIYSLPEEFKEAVGDRGRIVKWAPQKEVLAQKAVGGFWSHCGWNSTLESLSEGVPMICQPSFGDQRVNARLLSHVWRAGLEWNGDLERGEIERAVRKLMVDEEGKEMRQRAKELKENIMVSSREGGSSYNNINDLVHYILSISATSTEAHRRT